MLGCGLGVVFDPVGFLAGALVGVGAVAVVGITRTLAPYSFMMPRTSVT
jgi:hypothetical protein